VVTNSRSDELIGLAGWCARQARGAREVEDECLCED